MIEDPEAHADFTLEGPDAHEVIVVGDTLVPMLLDANLATLVSHKGMFLKPLEDL